jgi:DNA invertase Pin-like site-specific DNA recombinase
MRVGYARTSTLDQKHGLDAQIEELNAAGVEKTFREQLSSVDENRSQLEAAIDFVRSGDDLIVTKLDRLARSVSDLVEIEKRLTAKGAALKVLQPSLDTSTSTGRLSFNVIASVAQFEREIMLERQREGIQRAKLAGKYKGRAPTARRKAAEVQELRRQGVRATTIARTLGISRRSVYRCLEAMRSKHSTAIEHIVRDQDRRH